MKPLPPDTAVIAIDHGSRLREANDMLDEVVQMYRAATGAEIVEPAHMELASPTLGEAVARCTQRGARTIVVHPYFLAPGRHSTRDIPAMVAEVAAQYPEIRFRVTAPLGLDALMAQVMHRRIVDALEEP